jgi:tripeptide aminopeptidase
MKDVLDTCYFVVDYALEAIGRTGVKPVLSSIRGGTDGSRLSFMGLPCPNIYAGEHAFHSKLRMGKCSRHGKSNSNHCALSR